jgi:protein O-mannosyl-transferase
MIFMAVSNGQVKNSISRLKKRDLTAGSNNILILRKNNGLSGHYSRIQSGMKTDLKNNKSQQLILAGIIAVILVLMTYQGSFNNNFVGWDDDDYVVQNDLVTNPEKATLKDYFTTVISLNYHPLTILSLRINNNNCKTCPSGISARPFITGNVFLHILNTILVLLLIYRLSRGNVIVSFLVAALFGVHPMHVESVAWISERKDVLYSFFFLAGLISYLKYKSVAKNKLPWLILTFILFILSCLSKATAVVFPIILILIIYWMSGTNQESSAFKRLIVRAGGKDLFLLIPFFAISLFFGLMAVHVQGGENFLGMLKFTKEPESVVNIIGPFSIFQRFQISGYGFMTYAIKFLFPVDLCILYPYPSLQEMTNGSFNIKLWASFIGIILLIILTIWSLRKTKLYFFGIGFYFATVILVLQFISVGSFIMAERYTYLPYIGLSFIPATLIAGSSLKPRRILLLISGCVIIIFMILARQQVKVWFNTETLWTQPIDRHPHNELARRGRGKYYYMLSSHAKNNAEKNLYEDKATADFKEAIKAGTRDANVYEGMGVILQSRGDLDNALKYINAAISIDPKKGKTYYNRAMIYDKLNNKEEALTDYSRALNLDETLAKEVLSNRSVLFLETGKYKQAARDLDLLISIDDRDHMYYFNRAFSKVQLGDVAGAIDDYRRVLELSPDNQEAQKQLMILQDAVKNK